jgi:hypothetical protein
MVKETIDQFMQRKPSNRRCISDNFFKNNSTNNVFPVIVHAGHNVAPLAKFKFSVHEECSIASLMQVVRKSVVDVGGNEALFFLATSKDDDKGPILLVGSLTVGAAYNFYSDNDDGFLHLQLHKEDVFGGCV